MDSKVDVVVVGGGSAGLQAALTLGRMRFDVVVVDAGEPSNAPAHAIGGLLGAHDLAPLELLATGRKQLAELPSVRLIEGEATRVDEDLTVTVERGETYSARAVVLATGMDYGYPDVPGIAELWGNSVIHCPFCHGWEVRDQRIALLIEDEEKYAHLIPLVSRLSPDVEVLPAIAGVRSENGKLRAVVLPDGGELERDALFLPAPPTPRDAAFAHLPLERDGALIEVDSLGLTSVERIWAAGDLVVAAPAVSQAVASGQRTGVGITRALAVGSH